MNLTDSHALAHTLWLALFPLSSREYRSSSGRIGVDTGLMPQGPHPASFLEARRGSARDVADVRVRVWIRKVSHETRDILHPS
jgi:hypothetical protein